MSAALSAEVNVLERSFRIEKYTDCVRDFVRYN